MPDTYTLSLHDALPISLLEIEPALIHFLVKPLAPDTSTSKIWLCVDFRYALASSVTRLSNRASSAPTSSERVISGRSEEHTSELQSPCNLVCRLLLEKK